MLCHRARPWPSLALGIALGLWAGCGRSWVFDNKQALVPTPCSLELTPPALAYGLVGLGDAVTARVLLWNGGETACQVSAVALGPGTDADFELRAGTLQSFTIAPGKDASLNVDFDAASVAPPTLHTGTLTFLTGDPDHPDASVPLSATVHTICKLSVTPVAVDYGQVDLGSSTTQSVTLTNTGSAVCNVSELQLSAGSDPEFALGAGQPIALSLDPGAAATVPVTFDATNPAPPHQKTGKLTLLTGDPDEPSAAVPLTALIDVGCQLSVSPNPMDFGELALNQTVTDQVTLTDTGTEPCAISQLALGAGTDIDFTLPPQPTAFTVNVGAGVNVAVTFDAANPPPDRRNGTLTFLSTDGTNPNATLPVSVPLTGYIDTNCTSEGLLIYVVDAKDNMFSTFNPETQTFTDLGPLDCPDSNSPFSMAVDQNAIAWVLFEDGVIFRVDPATLACTTTDFVPDQEGLELFGMGFSFDSSTNTDTLFIAGGSSIGTAPVSLATVSFPALTVSVVAPLTQGNPELTGTGDGQLWGFFPSDTGSLGSPTPMMVQLDKQSGSTLQTLPVSSIAGSPEDWAVGFFGGAFWIFLQRDSDTATNVYEVQRSTGKLTNLIPTISPSLPLGRHIVGAGVSTCAPVQ